MKSSQLLGWQAVGDTRSFHHLQNCFSQEEELSCCSALGEIGTMNFFSASLKSSCIDLSYSTVSVVCGMTTATVCATFQAVVAFSFPKKYLSRLSLRRFSFNTIQFADLKLMKVIVSLKAYFLHWAIVFFTSNEPNLIWYNGFFICPWAGKSFKSMWTRNGP